MIQRIQTLFLSLGLLLMGLMAWLPLGEIAVGDNIFTFSIKGIIEEQTGKSIYGGVPLMILLTVILFLQVFIIFKFKKRILQIRIATYNIVLMLGFVAVSWYFVNASINLLGKGAYVFKLAMAFPLVSMILNYLAIRAIGKDEALIRSIDRIR